MYRHDITVEVELMHERGRFSMLPRSRPSRPAQVQNETENPRMDSGDDSSLDLNGDAPFPSDQHTDDESLEFDDDPPDPNLSHEFEYVEEFLFSESFFESVFDDEKFSFLYQAIVLDNDAFQDEAKMNTMKAKIVTSLARKISSSLALTKEQNDQLVRFWKAMVAFIAPERANITRLIFASYSSCVRQAEMEERRTQELCDEFMKKCLFFSIGVDTSLFRNQHVLSCFTRFCFQDGLVHVPLFFATCDVSTGNTMAEFVFNKLVENNAVFEKLVSITTDGAKNMTGRDNGMVAVLKQTIRDNLQARGINVFPVHGVWCNAHRMNLVTKDFLTLKGVDFVKTFCDWFTITRRQVNYKRFLRMKFPGQKFKVDPRPSETRWHYSKDVVACVLSQQDQTEEYLRTDPEFLTFWHTSKRSDEQLLVVQDGDLFFQNAVVNTRFQFVFVVLEHLGNVISHFQGRNISIVET